jgi:protein-tyrosine-phosphatase
MQFLARYLRLDQFPVLVLVCIASMAFWAKLIATSCQRASMIDRPYNVLFLCTGNSARSIIAEAILNKIGAGKFRAYSAGSQPKGQVHPETLRLLRSLGYDTTGFRSKSWVEFLKEPEFDFVFTVCDNAAAETCPIWPGQPMTAHWGVPDPAEATGTPAEIGLAFKEAYRQLNQRIEAFNALPLRALDDLTLPVRLRDIGRMEGSTAKTAEPA